MLSICPGCQGCRDAQRPSGWNVSSDAADARPDAGRQDTQVDGGRLADTGPEAGDTGDITPPDAEPSWCEPATPTPTIPTAQSCGTTVFGTDGQLQNTPREPRLEWLVLEAVDAFVAPECLYRRVEGEVKTIRRKLRMKNEKYGSISHQMPYHAGRGLKLFVDDQTADAIENSSYGAWRCLNRHYEKRSHTLTRTPLAAGNTVLLQLEGTYDMKRLLKAYSGLPGLVERDGRRVKLPKGIDRKGPSPEIDVCLDIDGQTHRYLFYAEEVTTRDGGYSIYFYFTASPDGNVELEGEWRGHPKQEKPEWFAICEGKYNP